MANNFYRAQVTSITDEGVDSQAGFSDAYQVVLLKLSNGPDAGKIVTVRYVTAEAFMDAQRLEKGDTVIVTSVESTPGVFEYQVLDHLRLPGVGVLLLVFILLAALLGRWKGVMALFGLGLSIVVLVFGVIPAILSGTDPLWATFLGTGTAAIVSMLCAHGFNRRAGVAIGATIITLLIAFAASALAVMMTHLTGVSSDDAAMLQLSYLPYANLRTILLAGMVIGTLGVLDDVTTAQVAAVEEISDAGHHRFSVRELYARGLSVGREHIASLVNTLALAYAGSSFSTLMLMMIPDGPPLWVIANSEFFVVEVVRALVGGASLMLAVPIVTALAAWSVAGKK